MNRILSGVFPDFPPELRFNKSRSNPIYSLPNPDFLFHFFCFSSRIFRDDQSLVVVGVIGRSTDAECNKMAGFDMIKLAPEPNASVQNGQIRFYFNESEGKTLYIHFQTMFDEMVMEKFVMEQMLKASTEAKEEPTQEKRSGRRRSSSNHSLHTLIRTKFAQILLFAIQVCHIIVLVEPNNVFDTSYLSIFKALKVIRYVHDLNCSYEHSFDECFFS